MRYTKAIVIASLFFGAIAPARVVGGPVTWEFTGELTSVRDLDGSLEGVFSVGMPFAGAYTFESTAPDTSPDNPRFAAYDDAVVGIWGAVGGIPFLASGNFTSVIFVSDASPGVDFDAYSLGVLDVSTGSLSDRSVLSLRFSDSTGMIFASDSLPLTPPDFEAVDSTLFSLELEPDGDVLLGELTALVPEPGTLALMVVALSFLTRRRTWRS